MGRRAGCIELVIAGEEGWTYRAGNSWRSVGRIEQVIAGGG